VILAQLEVFHSRPIAPTRRLALGRRLLPMAPEPGFGGILLGGVVATYAPALDEDLTADLRRLLARLEAGSRIPQPQLRHRLQIDRVGLLQSTLRLVGDGRDMRFDFEDRAAPPAYVLAAAYAAGHLPGPWRHAGFAVMRRALTWRGGGDERLIAFLAGHEGQPAWTIESFADPVKWALDVLDLEVDDLKDRRGIRRRFRDQVRRAHPDLGGADGEAAERIAELDEARRILLDAG
jgi:hypothetical protein